MYAVIEFVAAEFNPRQQQWRGMIIATELRFHLAAFTTLSHRNRRG
jgi:hypothetical protein